MKKLMSVVIALSLALGHVPMVGAEPVPVVPLGTKINVRLTSVVSTSCGHRKNCADSVGDVFRGELADPLISNFKTVVAPKGARVIGRILESRETNKKGKYTETLLSIELDYIEGTDRNIPLQTKPLKFQNKKPGWGVPIGIASFFVVVGWPWLGLFYGGLALAECKEDRDLYRWKKITLHEGIYLSFRSR